MAPKASNLAKMIIFAVWGGLLLGVARSIARPLLHRGGVVRKTDVGVGLLIETKNYILLYDF